MIDYSSFTDIIRQRVSADTVGQDFGLETGRSGRCRCIFCDGERDDTLRLYPGDRGFFCFRCHERGDVISLYRKLTGCGFRQAVEDLNERYGIGLPLSNADPDAIRKARAEAEKRKREREEKADRKKKLFEEYLDAADTVWLYEQLRRETAPKTPNEPWCQRFIVSLRYMDQMKEYRDRIWDELQSET